MDIKRRVIAPGAEVAVIPSDKFKSNYFSLNFQLPLSDEYITQANLLSAVLIRGCEKYKTSAELGRRIAMLYDPDITVRAAKTPCSLLFRVNVFFPSGRFLPAAGGRDIFDEVSALVHELLISPLTENGELCAVYTSGEKKNQLDNIRARINNKDTYAAYRCEKLALGNIPFACDSLGTEEELLKADPVSLYRLLKLILRSSRLLAVFAGDYGEHGEERISRFIASLLGTRREEELLAPGELVLPAKNGGAAEYTEEIDAVQSRLVLAYDMGYDIPLSPVATAKIALFNEIFGASPVSRLFMNVRERLNLCYYCSSIQQTATSMMYVMSGISEKNRENVASETQRQLSGLSDPGSITESDILSAKENILSGYRTLPDSLVQYAEWYISHALSGRSCDIQEYVSAVMSVTRFDVASVASKARLRVNYFLRGTGGGEKETDE